MEILAVLQVVKSLLDMVPAAEGQPDTTLGKINTLIGFATSGVATIEDGIRAWDLIRGVASGAEQIDAIEAEIETWEARGLKPIAPPDAG